ncbi:MAG: winged helix-turn-helix domain-containing protein [Pseudonocardiales bacterium]|nr:winged helix-turn-helix domain-containing protein [Pseudonocardiales bacterium]
MRWRALGPVEAVIAGRLVDLGPPRQRALFGLLLSRVDRPVAVDTVIEELWAGDPPAVAMASVRAYVSNLRRILEPDRPPRAVATVLRTRAPGYLLDSRGVDFDVRQFTQRAAAGRAALNSADPTRAVGEFDAALGLWRGQPYADMCDAAWAAPEISWLEEVRLSVVEGRCEAQLALGEHHSAVAELELHVRGHPLREHGCALLALALYRAGRQAEALGLLRATRTRLVDELGIDPGAGLQRLERDILTHAPALDWHPPPAVSVAEPAIPTSPSLTTVPTAAALPTEPSVGRVPRVVSAQVQGLTEVIGRDTELAALRAAFTDPARHGRPIWRVLTGLGGVGKTSLARAYAQRYQEHYGLVWWIRAEDREAVAGEFRALLDILSLHYAQHAHDPVQAVHAILVNRTDPWLLVIDNIAEPEALRGLLPAAGAGDVLVTSRAGTWPDRHVALPVRPLARSHAVELITSLSGDADQTSAAALAEELGELPLALAQASCYVAHSGLDLVGYLALYRSRRAELHQQGHAPDYPDTVATTWQLAFDQLSPPARALLNLLAWYAPDSIPLDRLFTPATIQLPETVTALVRPLLNDSVHQHWAITELLAYGLITRTGPVGSVTVHRLVQAVTDDQLTANHEHHAWINAAAVLLDAACPRWKWAGYGEDATTVWQSLQIHVRALIEHLKPDQPITLDLRHVHAYWTGASGETVRARELAAELVKDDERILGPDHPTTLLIRAAFAHFTGQAGEIRRARELAAAVVEDLTRVLGAGHVYTLFVQGSLIRWIGLGGEVERARDLNATVVEDVQQALGADDLLTLAHRARLVRWIGEAGDAARARELAAAVVQDDKRLLGPDHRETLAARSYLVRWTGEAGDAARARELAAELVEDDERILGCDHRHTLFARAYLARWTGESGNAEKAHKLVAAVLEDLARIYGAKHRYTLLARGWLAPWNQQRCWTTTASMTTKNAPSP